MTSPFTLPLLRRPYHDDKVVLTVSGKTHLTTVQDLEFMLATDGYAPLQVNDEISGFMRLSKSGNTVYAEFKDEKVRFPYGRFTGMLISGGGYVIGSICNPVGVTA
jgi:hypothetical protein